MPCPFTGPKMFSVGPIFFEPAQKTSLLNANHIFVWHVTKCLGLPQYVNKFLVWQKKFGLAQNILGPVKGQGIKCILLQVLQSTLRRRPRPI